MDIPLFARTQLTLLRTENSVSTAEHVSSLSSLPPTHLQRLGLALLSLSLSSQRTGLGGRTVLEFGPDPAILPSGTFPSHGLRSGDVVRLQELPSGGAKKREKAEIEGRGVEGVVHRVYDGKLVVAAKEDCDNAVDVLVTGGKRLWAVKLADEVTFKRMEKAMVRLEDLGKSPAGLMRVLFGHDDPQPVERVELEWRDKLLNESQKEAVRFAIGCKDVGLIHGPPGTGKTQTLLEIVRQLVGLGKRVLICGPSNISVDNIVLRLPAGMPIVRLGHPARLLPRVVERSLDVLTQTSEAGEIVKDVRVELDGVLGKLMASGKGRLKGKDRREGWEQVRYLRGEYRQRDARATRELISSAKVILCTLHGAGSRQLQNEKFDVLIIDEGSQALEAQCWVPLLLSTGVSKLLIAGDHHQLPPTVKSADSKPPKVVQPVERRFRIPTALEETLFSRLLTLHGEKIKRLLTVQYRMHNTIMRFPSKYLYDSKLVADPSVGFHLLSDLPHVEPTHETSSPLIFIDTQGGDFPEALVDVSDKIATSSSNPLEAQLAINHVRALISAGVKPSEIAVITPYNGQLAIFTGELREKYPDMELGSVDGFQGREKEAVVLSLVRSNEKRETGFLKDQRRINVAVTRARRHLCVLGDSETVKHADGFLKGWCKWVDGEGEGTEIRYPGLEDSL